MLVSFSALALLPCAALLCLGLLLCVVGQRWQRQALRAIGSSLGCAGLGLSWQVLLHPHQGPLPLWFVLGFTLCYLGVAIGGAGALAARWKVPMLWRTTAALVLGTLVFQAWFTTVQPDMTARIYGLSTVCAVLFVLPLRHWRRLHMANRYDRQLRWACIVLVLAHGVRTAVQWMGHGALPLGDYVQSSFWLGMHVYLWVAGLWVSALLVLSEVHVAMALLREQSQRDVLTGVLNRQGWQAQLQQLQAQHPQPQGWALVRLDLDYFKTINDAWGYAVGDQVLRMVAQLLQGPGHDRAQPVPVTVARWQGDEFVLLYAALTPAQALAAAQALCTGVAQLQLAAVPGLCISASVGVVALAQWHQLPQALHHAASLRRNALHAGGNQVASVHTVPTPWGAQAAHLSPAPPDGVARGQVHPVQKP